MTHFECFSGQGACPLQGWKSDGNVKRIFDSLCRGSVVQILATGARKSSIMNSFNGLEKGLVSEMPYLILQVYHDRADDFQVELVLGLGHSSTPALSRPTPRVSVTFSTGTRRESFTGIHAIAPFVLGRCHTWTNVCIDLLSFIRGVSKSASNSMSSIFSIKVSGAMRLRRIVFARYPLPCDEVVGEYNIQSPRSLMELPTNLDFMRATTECLNYGIGYIPAEAFRVPTADSALFVESGTRNRKPENTQSANRQMPGMSKTMVPHIESISSAAGDTMGKMFGDRGRKSLASTAAVKSTSGALMTMKKFSADEGVDLVRPMLVASGGARTLSLERKSEMVVSDLANGQFPGSTRHRGVPKEGAVLPNTGRGAGSASISGLKTLSGSVSQPLAQSLLSKSCSAIDVARDILKRYSQAAPESPAGKSVHEVPSSEVGHAQQQFETQHQSLDPTVMPDELSPHLATIVGDKLNMRMGLSSVCQGSPVSPTACETGLVEIPVQPEGERVTQIMQENKYESDCGMSSQIATEPAYQCVESDAQNVLGATFDGSNEEDCGLVSGASMRDDAAEHVASPPSEVEEFDSLESQCIDRSPSSKLANHADHSPTFESRQSLFGAITSEFDAVLARNSAWLSRMEIDDDKHDPAGESAFAEASLAGAEEGRPAAEYSPADLDGEILSDDNAPLDELVCCPTSPRRRHDVVTVDSEVTRGLNDTLEPNDIEPSDIAERNTIAETNAASLSNELVEPGDDALEPGDDALEPGDVVDPGRIIDSENAHYLNTNSLLPHDQTLKPVSESPLKAPAHERETVRGTPDSQSVTLLSYNGVLYDPERDAYYNLN